MAKKPTRQSRARTQQAQKLGFSGDVGAMKATTRQYGLVKNQAGQWVRPDMAFLERQMAANGWLNQPNVKEPVGIGGQHVLVGQGKVEFSGKYSDLAKNAKAGTAYKAAGVNAKGAGGKGGKGGKGKGKGKGKPKSGGVVPTTDGALAGSTSMAGPTASAYAEADTTSTSMLRAQGKAYAAGREGMGGGRRGADYSSEGEAPVPGSESGAGKKRRAGKPRKFKVSRKKAGVKAGYHRTRAGTVVKNSGNRRPAGRKGK